MPLHQVVNFGPPSRCQNETIIAERHDRRVFQHFFEGMSKRSNDILFQLIHSLEKAEKRHFKLFIKRNSSNENLKIVQLFDAMDKMEEYDEAKLLKRLPAVQKVQLSNLK